MRNKKCTYVVEAIGMNMAKTLMRKYDLPPHKCIYYNPKNTDIDKYRGLIMGTIVHVNEEGMYTIADWQMFNNKIQIYMDYEEQILAMKKLLDKWQYDKTIVTFKDIVKSMGYTDDLKIVTEVTVMTTWFLKCFLAGLTLPMSINITKFLYSEREENRFYDINYVLNIISQFQTMNTVVDKELLDKLLAREEDI